jgi:ABC-type bacteriocin/lantibiotic exporter with double-glycine peptidase domain
MSRLLKVPYYAQMQINTCGPASLKMVFDFFGDNLTEPELVRAAKTTKDGTPHFNLINVARRNGFYCYVHEGASFNQIKHFIDIGFPVIINYQEPDTNDGHYAVVVGYKRNTFILNDPWNGHKFKLLEKDLNERWYDYHDKKLYHRWILVLSKKHFSIGKQYNPKGRLTRFLRRS